MEWSLIIKDLLLQYYEIKQHIFNRAQRVVYLKPGDKQGRKNNGEANNSFNWKLLWSIRRLKEREKERHQKNPLTKSSTSIFPLPPYIQCQSDIVQDLSVTVTRLEWQSSYSDSFSGPQRPSYSENHRLERQSLRVTLFRFPNTINVTEISK